MKPEEILAKVKELIGEGNIDKAQEFIESHKEDLGEYFDKAKGLLDNANGAQGLMDKVKNFF